jgi:hypothetical protein
MTIDIRLKTGQLKLAFVLLISLTLFLLIYSTIEGIEKNLILFVISIILGICYIFMLILKLHYFYFNDDKNKIIIRFYNSHPFFRKYKAFEIPKNNVKNFDITESFFGLKKELTIEVSTKTGSFEYPPVSISLLSKKEIKALEKKLNEYM